MSIRHRLLPLLVLLPMATRASAINLGTFNLRYDNKGDVEKGNPWTLRGPMIAQMIRFHQFDLVGTQEGLSNQIKDLTALMPEYDSTGCGRDDGQDQGEHVQIFFRKDKFKLLDSGHFWLSETPDQPGKGWDAALPRICAWGKFEELASHTTFFFFSTHFDHRGKEARKNSAALIVHKIEELAKDQPAVLTGDFNVDQTSESYDVLHSTDQLLRDSHELAAVKLEPNGTPNNFDPTGRTESRIDHVFVTRHFSVSRWGVLTDSYRTPKVSGSGEHGSTQFPSEVVIKEYEARLPSDHYPVLAEASFNP